MDDIMAQASRMNYENKIFPHDSREMSELPDNSVNLMVTSPPYNVTKQYDDDLSLSEYLALLEDILTEVHRVLKPGGIAALNIANAGRKPYLPLDSYIINIFKSINYSIIQEIIWNKAASAGGSCAWGSWKSASNPSLRDVHEYIIIAQKKGSETPIALPFDDINKFPEKIEHKTLDIDLQEYITDIWSFNTESAKRVNHPAPFPAELPFRIITFFTHKGDLVLDPFMGSGSAAIAAVVSGRKFIGYDIDPQYVKLAYKRVKELKINLRKSRNANKEKNSLLNFI